MGEAETGLYGGTDPHDNSGILRYVRVEFAGYQINSDKELNGIALQGVGDGTRIDHIQVVMCGDDGIEFFGGTVNAKYLLVSGAEDDSFDWTDGWSGKDNSGLPIRFAGPIPERSTRRTRESKETVSATIQIT